MDEEGNLGVDKNGGHREENEGLREKVAVPVFYPSSEEFHDFVSYIRKISPIAEKVGMCKICPPKGWLPPCLVEEDHGFTAVSQNFGSNKDAKSVLTSGARWKETERERQFTVLSFGEMADDFKRDYFKKPVDKISDEQVIKEFWNLVDSSSRDFPVYKSLNLDSVSGFPTQDSKNLFPEDIAYLNSNWNLNKVAEQSVLKYLTCKSPMKVPKCSIGMCFSHCPWKTGEYWSCSINYLHWGEQQTWYCVSRSDLEAFEQFTDEQNFSMNSNGQENTMINPKSLITNGIQVSTIVQGSGEFLVTFPRSSVACVSHGFNLLESVNFCPESWIQVGYDYWRCQQTLARPCCFSFEELLFRLLLHLDSLDVSLFETLRKILSTLMDKESQAIKRISNLGLLKRKQEAFELVAIGDRRCFVCQKICFLSAVTCCDNKKLVCLNHFDSLCHCPPAERRLHYRYALTALDLKLMLVDDRIKTYEQWVQKVKDVLSASGNERLGLGQMRQLRSDFSRLYPSCHLVARLNEAISEAENHAAFARRRVLNTHSGGASEGSNSKLTVEELTKFYDAIKRIPVCLKITDKIATLLDTTISFRSRLQTVIVSGSISDCSTLEDLMSASVSMPVILEETTQLHQLLEQRKWLDRVDRLLATTDCVTIESIGKLIDEGVGIHPHPTCEKMLVHLQQLQSHCHRIEDRAKNCLYHKPSCPLSVVEALLNEASKIPVHLPTVLDLRTSAEKASVWLANVENILNGQSSPYLTEVEKCLEIGHSIPIQLDKTSELESLITKADEWIERTSRAFLKKNSVFSLYEVLCPRTDIGTPQSYKIRRKKAVDHRSGTSVLPVHWLLPEIDLLNPDPATVANAFKTAEYKEVEDILSLRNINLKKLSLEFSPSARHCICRQGRTSNMMQCELCKEIFHSSCVSLPKSFLSKPGKTASNPSSSDLKFFCPMCMRTRRPHLDTVVGLLLELGKFPIRLPEGEALQSLAEHAFSWQDRARRLLSTDELAQALARLTVLNQQMAEHAAKVKTEKIIHSELLKAAKHGLTGQGIDYIQHRHSFPQTFRGSVPPMSLPYSDLNEPQMALHEVVEVEMGTTPFEHAYSSASKSNMSPSLHHPRHPGSYDPILKLSDATLLEVEQLIIEGDLLEVSIEETHHLWKIMKVCRPDQTEAFHPSDVTGRDYGQVVDEKLEKTGKRKRKSSHNMKIDESFEVESIPKQIRLKSKKLKSHAIPERKSEMNYGDKSLKYRMKQKRERSQTTPGLDLDKERCLAKTAEDCDVEKCLRPLGNAVKWVQCDGCEKWFHYFCLGLTKRDISEHEDFLCRLCRPATSCYVVPSGNSVPLHHDNASLPSVVLPSSSFQVL